MTIISRIVGRMVCIGLMVVGAVDLGKMVWAWRQAHKDKLTA